MLFRSGKIKYGRKSKSRQWLHNSPVLLDLSRKKRMVKSFFYFGRIRTVEDEHNYEMLHPSSSYRML